MTNYRIHEVPYKQARRAYERLLREHRDEIADRDEFDAADRSICPELWDAAQREPNFNCAAGAIEESLFLTVADAFGLDPVILDDTLLAMANYQTDRLLNALDPRRPLFEVRTTRIVCKNELAFGPDTHACTPEAAMRDTR